MMLAVAVTPLWVEILYVLLIALIVCGGMFAWLGNWGEEGND